MSSQPHFSTGDWVVILAYLAGIMGLGIWIGRDQRNTRDYFLGSRNVSWWLIGMSIVAAETSALTIIGVPAMAYGGNMAYLQMVLGFVIARLLLALLMVPHYFRGEIYSPYQLLADAFGPAARRTSGGFFLISETLAAGVRVYVACIPVQLLLGLQVLPAIVLFVGLSLVYTYVGGVKAVIWTDAIQFGLFLLGGVFAVVYIPTLVEGGLPAVWEQAAGGGKLHWFNTHLDTLARSGAGSFLHALLAEPFNIWMGLIGGTFVTLSSHGAEQLIVQRVLACRNLVDGRKALLLSAVVILPLFFVFLLAGAMLWVFYQGHPFQIPIPEMKPGSGIRANDFIFPIFIITEVPHLLRGFLIVAILSAAMSSVSSALTALASVSTMDFVKGQHGTRSEEFYLRCSKYSTVFWAAMLIGVAYLSREVRFVLNAAFSLRGLTSGALLGGILLAVFRRSGGPGPVIAGMVASLAVMTAIQVLPKLEATRPLWEKMVGAEIFWPWYTLIGTTVTLVTAEVVRCLFGKRR